MEWKNTSDLVVYPDATAFMEDRVAGIRAGTAEECIWLLEHPPLYTAGTSAKERDLRSPQFPVYETGRGGQYTYHGPGQRVAYVMLDLKQRQKEPDLKHYVWQLEEWIIRTLAEFDITGERREDRVGIWVTNEQRAEAKIAAIGVRVRHWVSYHGISINVDPVLEHFGGVVPCGIADHGVTSMRQMLGSSPRLEAVDQVLRSKFDEVFS